MNTIASLAALILVASMGLTGCGGGSNSQSQSSASQTSEPTLTSITVTGPANAIAAGSSLQLAAKGTYSDHSTSTLTAQVSWRTSDSTVASISATGLLTGIKPGSITVTATERSTSGSMSVSVTPEPVTLAYISVIAPSTSLVAGARQQLTVTGTYSDGSTQNVSSQAAWQSSDNTIATVTASGLLTAIGTGTATITASIGTVFGTTSITVTASSSGTPFLSALSIIPPSFSIASGQNKQLAASGVYSDGTIQDVTAHVTWSSSPTNLITVSPSGLATGVAAGSAIITASLGSVSASATGTVTSAQLDSIVVSPASASVAIGKTQLFSANGVFSDGSSSDLTSSVAWLSSATTIGTIDQTGLAMGVATGTTIIGATSGSATGTASLSVTSAVLVAIDIAPDGQSIPVGGQYQLTVTGSYSDNTTQAVTDVSWASSDPSLAVVDPLTGIVTGVANSNGNPVTITATLGRMSSTTTVYVTSATIESLVLTPSTSSIAKGTTQQYSINAIYSDGTIQPITLGLTWSSSSPAIAAVSGDGLAVGLGPGQCTIAASYGSLSTTATLSVTPANLSSIVVTPAAPTVGIKGNLQFTATGAFSDGSAEDLTEQVTWRSSTANVALISSAGVATALSVGTTDISADYDGVSGSSALTVTSAKLVSIAITPANPVVPPRSRIQLAAIGVYSDGTTSPLSDVSWHTDNGRYATVSSTGLLRTKKSTAQPIPIYASVNGITGQTTLIVTSMAVASLQIAPSAPTIAMSTTQPFKLIGTFNDGTTTVDLSASAEWQTSDYNVAVITRSGVATGRASGTATIIGSYGNVAPARTTLTVSGATIQGVTVSPSTATIGLGTTQAFEAVGTFSDGSSQNITSVSQWTSSTPAVAVVNQAGLASSAGQGRTNVTATFKGVSGSAVLTVQ